jgi:hypothetical protein
LVVLKNPIIAEIPRTNEECAAASCADILITTAGTTQLIGDVKILDAVSSWVQIKNVDFNLKQSLLMGIYSNVLMGKQNQSEWEKLLLNSGKKITSIIWDVFNGQMSLASVKEKGYCFSDIKTIEAIASSGILSVFGDKIKFIELGKNLGKKFKTIHNKNSAYSVIISETYIKFMKYKISSSADSQNISQYEWSPFTLEFWQSVIEQATVELRQSDKASKKEVVQSIINVKLTEIRKKLNNIVESHDLDQIVESDMEQDGEIDSMPQRPVATPAVQYNARLGVTNIITPPSPSTPLRIRQAQFATAYLSDCQVSPLIATKCHDKEKTGVEKLIELCQNTTELYHKISDDINTVDWIKSPTREDFFALVAEDMKEFNMTT